MTEESLASNDAVPTQETPEAIEQPVETEISADELSQLRQQADELKDLQTKLAAQKRKEEILQRAKAEEIKGVDRIYDYLDQSLLTDEKLPEIFAAINDHLRPRQVPIGASMNVSGTTASAKSSALELAEAAEKARTSGRVEDLAAYSKLRRLYGK